MAGWSDTADQRFVHLPSVPASKMRSGVVWYLDHFRGCSMPKDSPPRLHTRFARKVRMGIGSVRDRRGRQQGAVARGGSPRVNRRLPSAQRMRLDP
jgi:hypothetical protein